MRINFRQKDLGWNLYALLLQYNNSAYKTNHHDDLFMKLFLSNVILRDSCYNCSFKKKNRLSDITLADFWGIDNIDSSINDNKGVSLVIVNSEKGRKLFDKIKENTVYKPVNFEESIKYNPSMYSSVEMPKTREKFFKDLDKYDFDALVKKYCTRDNIFKKAIRKMKRVVKKIIK